MARILGIDYGLKRCGIAVTDPFQIIVNALDTVETKNLETYLTTYFQTEKVEKIIFGHPVHKDGNDTYLVKNIQDFCKKIHNKWPDKIIDFQDESFTSSMAKDIIMMSGAKKKKRQDKALVDRISAVIILQKYLKHI
ncbi:MAG: Holliday junction resolvase RuvX [Saprospiraceae bacterium]|nr:Holliday junction resolvase RuvX [Saprospiraceae bacterium]